MNWRLLCFACLLGLAMFVNARSSDLFAGSKSCKTCHEKIYEDYLKTGHPYKLNKINGAPPVYPANTSPGVLHPPAGYNWEDISYVIGGFGWKARFIDKQGYILTGDAKQYNFANSGQNKDAHWVAYGDPKLAKPYTCGDCHTTGWVPSGVDGPHQDGLPGIHGTWSEPGVTCEACHGPSAAHVKAPMQHSPTTEENCSNCHARGEPTKIDANAGLIKHHEQYEDLLASPHSAFTCKSCHNPHQSTKYQTGGYKGDSKTCKSCHQNVQIKLEAKADFTCHSCHMPFAVKSALSSTSPYVGGTVQKGDLRTHINRISTDPNWKMFTDDGAFIRLDNKNKAHLTLDYTCLSCHSDKDKTWAFSHAKNIH
jgi:hypothetical protein